MPSSTAPSRSIARREASFSDPVFSVTRSATSSSNAWRSSSRFISVLANVRWWARAIHVQPISSRSSRSETLPKRVVPIARAVAFRTSAKGSSRPASRASCARFSHAAKPPGPYGPAGIQR